MPKKLLWIDLEMTGLDPEKQVIIEVAAVVTDFSLTEIARYESLVHHAPEVLAGAEDWPKEHMQELFTEVAQAEKNNDEVQAELIEFVRTHFDEPAILAGNSIHQDRRFIRASWPLLEQKLHYRMLDVSTLKVWLEGTKGVSYEKKEAHRALGDILESISELSWALQALKD